VVPTTSRPPRRSRSKSRSVSRDSSPLKGIRISVTLIGAGREQLERLAEKGLDVEEKGGDLSVALAASSPEEALAQLRLLSGLLAQRP
jgi:hypothetical protein